jgi:hypothetical protein
MSDFHISAFRIPHSNFRIPWCLKPNKKRASQFYTAGCPFYLEVNRLGYRNIYRCRTFGTLLNVKSHVVAFIKGFETDCIYP